MENSDSSRKIVKSNAQYLSEWIISIKFVTLKPQYMLPRVKLKDY